MIDNDYDRVNVKLFQKLVENLPWKLKKQCK